MKLRYLLVISAAALAFVSCSKELPTETQTVIKLEKSVPGSEITSVTTFQATVTAVDPKKREVTVVTKESKALRFEAGPEVVNFDQIEVGDQLTMSLTEELQIRLAKPGEKIEDETTGLIELPPVGKKPGMRTTEITQSSAVISVIDSAKRKVTLTFTDGSKETFSVRDDIDLKERAVGETVFFKTTSIYEITLK